MPDSQWVGGKALNNLLNGSDVEGDGESHAPSVLADRTVKITIPADLDMARRGIVTWLLKLISTILEREVKLSLDQNGWKIQYITNIYTGDSMLKRRARILVGMVESIKLLNAEEA